MGHNHCVPRSRSKRLAPIKTLLLAFALAFGFWTAVSVPAAANSFTAPGPLPGIRPIVFIPGITGSFLTNANGNEVWPNVAGLLACVGSGNPVASVSYRGQEGCDKAALKPDMLAADGAFPIKNNPQYRTDVANGVYSAADGTLYGAIDSYPGKHVYDFALMNFESSGYLLTSPDCQLLFCDARPYLGSCKINGMYCVVPAAVDWRKSAVFNAGRILDLIDKIIKVTGTDRVNIVAHSQGGLIVNALLHMPGSVGKIYRVVTLGTPYLGTPKLLAVLLFKEPCLADLHLPAVNVKVPVTCLLNQDAVQEIIKNFPGAYELMPSQAYFGATAYAPLLSGVINGVPLSMTYSEAQQYTQQVLEGINRDMTLANNAQLWHASVDNWSTNPPLDPKVNLARMVGYDASDDGACSAWPCTSQNAYTEGTGTISAIDASNGQLYYASGDGTVELNSASLFNPSKGFDLRGGMHNQYWCAVNHQGLAQSQVVWDWTQPFLEGKLDYTADAVRQKCPDGTLGSLTGVDLGGQPTSLALALSPSTIPADGRSTSTATVTLTDGSGAGVAGQSLTLSTSGDVSIDSATDNGNGIYTATITASTTADQETITATDAAAGLSAAQTLTETSPSPVAVWSVVPNPSNGVLQGVSCVSTSFCMAVGCAWTDCHSSLNTIANKWNGANWSAVPILNGGTTSLNAMQSVSCVSPSFCMAVGYTDAPGYVVTLVEQWNGTNWAIVPSPNPGIPVSNTSLPRNELMGVSCVSASSCTAVGWSTYSGNSCCAPHTLVEAWDGSTWSIVPSSDLGTAGDELRAVSCVSASFCSAVGWSAGTQPLIENWNGSNWSIVPSPLPAVPSDSLEGVSCSSATSCTAVGYTGNQGGSLIEAWDGSNWSIVPNSPPNGQNVLHGVSCLSPSFCISVGEYTNSTSLIQTLVEAWNGSSWSIMASPNVGTFSSFAGGEPYPPGNTVSCASSNFCVAVGMSTGGMSLIEQFS